MKSDEHEPLVSEWSATAHPATRPASLPIAPSLAPHELLLEEEVPFAPGSPERRARLQRYVKVTVAGCALLCLAAMVRVGVARVSAGSEDDGSPPAITAHAAQETANVPAPPVSPPAPAPVAEATPGAPAPPLTAVQERELARRALERGKARDAIAAAERATAADPTDAESWLILGSANQEIGHAAAARVAFRSCLKLAKRGPLRECRAMLH
jgi:hypothetical protein